MAINWTNVGSSISGLASALSSVGVSSTSLPTILGQIGKLANPNQSDEISICSQILIAASNPSLVAALETKLATEVGIPPAAASLALTLANPGVDIPTRVLQIEQIIKAGS